MNFLLLFYTAAFNIWQWLFLLPPECISSSKQPFHVHSVLNSPYKGAGVACKLRGR